MGWLVLAALLALAGLAFRGARWAYAAFVVLGLLSFGLRSRFHLDPQPCEVAFSAPLAIHSLANYKHVALFAFFFVLTCRQWRAPGPSTLAWGALATLAMGVLVEAAEGVTGRGHCRVRDMVPNTAGALLGAGLVLLTARPATGRTGETPSGPPPAPTRNP